MESIDSPTTSITPELSLFALSIKQNVKATHINSCEPLYLLKFRAHHKLYDYSYKHCESQRLKPLEE